MSMPPELPQSIAADRQWGRLMHTLGKRVPAHLYNAELARRQLRSLRRRVR